MQFYFGQTYYTFTVCVLATLQVVINYLRTKNLHGYGFHSTPMFMYYMFVFNGLFYRLVYAVSALILVFDANKISHFILMLMKISLEEQIFVK